MVKKFPEIPKERRNSRKDCRNDILDKTKGRGPNGTHGDAEQPEVTGAAAGFGVSND
jgi:hypothetical protein